MYGVSVPSSVPRDPKPGRVSRSGELENLKSTLGFGFLFLGIQMGSPFSEKREPVVTCSKIEDRLYPDICVSKNA